MPRPRFSVGKAAYFIFSQRSWVLFWARSTFGGKIIRKRVHAEDVLYIHVWPWLIMGFLETVIV